MAQRVQLSTTGNGGRADAHTPAAGMCFTAFRHRCRDSAVKQPVTSCCGSPLLLLLCAFPQAVLHCYTGSRVICLPSCRLPSTTDRDAFSAAEQTSSAAIFFCYSLPATVAIFCRFADVRSVPIPPGKALWRR